MLNTSVRHRLVVGGIAYILTSEPEPDLDNIEVIKNWPGNVGNFEKAPTEISYTGNSSAWGYEIHPGSERSGYFKLLLDAKASTTEHDSPELTAGNGSYARIPLPPGKSALAVTIDYLRHLYSHLMNTLRQRLMATISTTPIQFVLTTPAIWSHEAQEATCKAAKAAGFTQREGDTLSMVSEPEAAASYCVKEMFSKRRETVNPLRIGERIVVCDAGGGTVDLITYTVDRVTPTLRLCEAVVGSGGKCGSVALDKAFLKLLEARVGDRFRSWPPKKTGRGSALMQMFDTAKKEFGTTTHTEWRIPLGYIEDDLENGIEDCELCLTMQDMTGIFDPVVKQVIDLIAGQVQHSNTINGRNKVSVCPHVREATSPANDSHCQTILLVGGFGESKYLYGRVEEWARESYSITVKNPERSWSAVVRGAVLHGVGGIVHTRKLKQHYGVKMMTAFIPGKHDEAYAYVDPFDGSKLFTRSINWLAAKGDDASVEKVISIPACSTFAGPGRKLVTHSLVGSVLWSKGDEVVDTLGEVICDLTNMPPSAFRTKNNAAPPERPRIGLPPPVTQASFSINMRVGSADIDLDLVYQNLSFGKASFKASIDD